MTGGARRLGRHLCLALAARGYDVVILYRESEDDARRWCGRSPPPGDRPACDAVDVGVESQVAAVFADIARESRAASTCW